MAVPQTSTIPAVLDKLKQLLEAEAAIDGSTLEGVVVFAAPSGDASPFESIQFYGTEDDSHSWESLGGHRRRERFVLAGDIAITKRGAGDDVAKAARDRAYAIAAGMQIIVWNNARLEIEGDVRTSIQFSTGTLDQGWQENGRVAFVRFSIAVDSQLTR